jgi:hypothetical protein
LTGSCARHVGAGDALTPLADVELVTSVVPELPQPAAAHRQVDILLPVVLEIIGVDRHTAASIEACCGSRVPEMAWIAARHSKTGPSSADPTRPSRDRQSLGRMGQEAAVVLGEAEDEVYGCVVELDRVVKVTNTVLDGVVDEVAVVELEELSAGQTSVDTQAYTWLPCVNIVTPELERHALAVESAGPVNPAFVSPSKHNGFCGSKARPL